MGVSVSKIFASLRCHQRHRQWRPWRPRAIWWPRSCVRPLWPLVAVARVTIPRQPGETEILQVPEVEERWGNIDVFFKDICAEKTLEDFTNSHLNESPERLYLVFFINHLYCRGGRVALLLLSGSTMVVDISLRSQRYSFLLVKDEGAEGNSIFAQAGCLVASHLKVNLSRWDSIHFLLLVETHSASIARWWYRGI